MFELVCDVTCDKPWTISPIGRENKIPFNVSILLFRFFTSVTVGEGRNSSALMAFSMWSVMSGLVLLWVSQAAAQHGVDLDECERAGLSAGAAAVRGACAALELECPLPDVELRSSYPSSIPEVLFGEVLRGSCTLLFQTSCKIAAVGTIFNSPEYQNCTSILSYGPPRNAPEKCADQTMAFQIYSSTIDSICNQELDDLPPASLQSSAPSGSSTPETTSGGKKIVEKDEVLVSEKRPTFQSTTAYGAFSSRAVDRDAGSCTHTGYGYSKSFENSKDPWWVVDLGARRKITRILITNRKDCCGDRLSDFEIRIGDAIPLGNGRGNSATRNRICQSGLSVPEGITKEFRCPMVGRYIVIRIPGENKVLTLCDVKVYAEENNSIRPVEEKILSAFKPTFQSSTLWSAVSGKATDGNRNGVFSKGSCTHTGMGPGKKRTSNPWWAVDLGSAQKISSIRITTRSDCCSDWLDNFEIRVGKWRPQGLGNQNSACQHNLKIPRGETYQFDCPTYGRYVTIRVPGREKFLTLCEVEVLG